MARVSKNVPSSIIRSPMSNKHYFDSKNPYNSAQPSPYTLIEARVANLSKSSPKKAYEDSLKHDPK